MHRERILRYLSNQATHEWAMICPDQEVSSKVRVFWTSTQQNHGKKFSRDCRASCLSWLKVSRSSVDPNLLLRAIFSSNLLYQWCSHSTLACISLHNHWQFRIWSQILRVFIMSRSKSFSFSIFLSFSPLQQKELASGVRNHVLSAILGSNLLNITSFSTNSVISDFVPWYWGHPRVLESYLQWQEFLEKLSGVPKFSKVLRECALVLSDLQSSFWKLSQYLIQESQMIFERFVRYQDFA